MDFFVVDAFAEGPFTGNPAAVCLTGQASLDETWMQAVAAEVNLSETAFVTGHPSQLRLRWFTPLCEVELCGHATLAAAHVLWETGRADTDGPLTFDTRGGLLSARRGSSGISPVFPVDVPTPAVPDSRLAAALGVEVRAACRGRFDWLVEIDDAATLRHLVPDMVVLRALGGRGVIVTAGGDGADGADFVSRFFAPAVGIDEDPVTGSAHCALAPYWAGKLGRTELLGRQLSARSGSVQVALHDDAVTLTGDAVTVIRGQLAEPSLPLSW